TPPLTEESLQPSQYAAVCVQPVCRISSSVTGPKGSWIVKLTHPLGPVVRFTSPVLPLPSTTPVASISQPGISFSLGSRLPLPLKSSNLQAFMVAVGGNVFTTLNASYLQSLGSTPGGFVVSSVGMSLFVASASEQTAMMYSPPGLVVSSYGNRRILLLAKSCVPV